MKLILELSQENLFLARAEAEALAGKKGFLLANLLFIDGKNPEILAKRLSMTHKIFSPLFDCSEKALLNRIDSFDWQRIYRKDFKVQSHDFDSVHKIPSRELADHIWRRLKDPKANMQNPKTDVNFLFTKKKVFVTLLLHEVGKDFLNRKAHLKPALHPTAMNPKIARAMINLTGIKKGDLYDPFCGSGGIIIEAAFMGLSPVGYDISLFMLEKAKENLAFYKKKAALKQDDATQIKHRMDYVATDLPYGLNSSRTAELGQLYLDFLRNCKFKRAAIGFPDFVDYRKIIRKAKRKILGEYVIYLHKSLSKVIVVVE